MKLKESLAAEYWIDNTNKIYEENLHVSSPVMEAYEAGFNKALELSAKFIEQSWTNESYRGMVIEDAIKFKLPCDVLQIGEEDV